MVMPTMPPRARALMLIVPAVPRRKEGTERVRATTANELCEPSVLDERMGRKGGVHTWNDSGDRCCDAEQG
jgi:hypothetical protein